MTPRIPRSSRIRGPLDPLPEPADRRITDTARDALWGCLFAVFGIVLMVTTPTGTGMAPVHMFGAIVGMISAAYLLGRANESHADEHRKDL